MKKILEEIRQERIRQDLHWGVQNHPHLDKVLLERGGNCTAERMCDKYEIPSENRAKFLCSEAFKKGNGTFAHILVEEVSEVISAFDPKERRKELIQVAVVAVAMIESIDNKNNNYDL